MEKRKRYFEYNGKIYWVWMTDKQFKALGFDDKHELTEEQFNTIKQYFKK